jgi:hypothetical protein
MSSCIVPGCTHEAQNNLSVRLRRPNTSAIWAPNTEAFVCDVHAASGARIHVLYEATESQEIETHVHGWASEPSRRTEIRQPARQMTDDLSIAVRERTEKVADL